MILLQHLPTNNQLLTILQHKSHPRPLVTTRVLPTMHRSPLHSNISRSHQLSLPRIQHQFNLSLNHDAIIQTLRSVHHALKTWGEVYRATDCAMRVYKTEFARWQYAVVSFDISVVVKVRWKLRGRVGDIESHLFVVVDGPVCRACCFDNCFAGIIVTGEVGGYRWQVWDLRLLRRHDDGVLLLGRWFSQFKVELLGQRKCRKRWEYLLTTVIRERAIIKHIPLAYPAFDILVVRHRVGRTSSGRWRSISGPLECRWYSENIINRGERSSGLPFRCLRESFQIPIHGLSSVGAKVAHRHCNR